MRSDSFKHTPGLVSRADWWCEWRQYIGQLHRQGSLNNIRRGWDQSEGEPSPASARGQNYTSPFLRMHPYPQDSFLQQPPTAYPQHQMPADPFDAQDQTWDFRRMQLERDRSRMMQQGQFKQQQQQQQQGQRPRSDPAYSVDSFGVADPHARSFDDIKNRPPSHRGMGPMRDTRSFPCVTTDTIPGYEVRSIVGPVQASVPRDERTSLANDRRAALQKMIEEAKMIRANGVLGMKFDPHVPSGVKATEVAVYGTACIVRPLQAPQRGQERGSRYRRRRHHSYSDESDAPSEEEDRQQLFPTQEDVFGTSLGSFGDGMQAGSFNNRHISEHRNGKVSV